MSEIDNLERHGSSAVPAFMDVRHRSDLEHFAPAVDMELDPGIREAVLILRRGGIDTFESCEGGLGHACPEPIIRFHGDQWEGFKAFAIAKAHGLNVLSIAYEYKESNGWLEGPWWKMTFRSTALISCASQSRTTHVSS